MNMIGMSFCREHAPLYVRFPQKRLTLKQVPGQVPGSSELDRAVQVPPPPVRGLLEHIVAHAVFMPNAQTMAGRERKVRKWSAAVTRNSDALDLEKNVFEKDDPAEIARSLEQSAERSKRRKATPFRSAMSMLTFYINRAGKNLSSSRKNKLEAAKIELRRIFGGKER
jgi:Protein of unknown function (DUF3175)